MKQSGLVINDVLVSRLQATSSSFWHSVELNSDPIFRDKWMPPGPPPPVLIDTEDIRSFDYPSFVNTNSYNEPRRKSFTIYQLRAWADNCEILRAGIETCKSQLKTLRYEFHLKNTDGLKTPDQVKQATENNANIKRCRKYFRKPNGRHTFKQWISMLVEELLVIDKVCVYNQKNLKNVPFQARLIDGNTIVPKIDRSGETPMAPHVAYQQVLQGVVTADLTRDDILVYNSNPRVHQKEGFSPVEQLLQIVEIALKRSEFQLNYYTEGNIPDMILRVSAQWSDEQLAKYQKYFDKLLAGDLSARRKIRFVPEALDPIYPQEGVLTKDNEFDEWIARIVCHVLGISPNNFIRNLNRAVGETQRSQADEEGMFSRMETIKEVIDLIIADWLGIDDVEFVWIPNKSQDSQKQAEIDKIHVETGIRSIDEVRASQGLHPIGVGNTVKTAHGYVSLLKDEPDYIEETKTDITTDSKDTPNTPTKSQSTNNE